MMLKIIQKKRMSTEGIIGIQKSKSKKRSRLTFVPGKWLPLGYDWAFYSETQIIRRAERADGRGNGEGRYISSYDILIGFSKSLPSLHRQHPSIFHHPSTNNYSPHPSAHELADQWD